MSFNAGLEIGDNISNNEIHEIFKCSNQGGMRRSLGTGTLVIISDHTKGLYQDKWENGILYYTGMGQVGEQVLDGNQNKTLYDSNTNGVEVHLFEVIDKSIYTYRGIMKLASKPYREKQIDAKGDLRMVWMFPLKSISDQEKVSNEFNISEIRIIPMSAAEFNNFSYEDVQKQFFLRDLIARDKCAFYYRHSGLKSYNNALLLFQFNSSIIASARLDEVYTFEKKHDGDYNGAFYLYPDSIRVFEPISLKDLQTVCPDFTGFNQTKQYVDINYLYAILTLIDLKSKDYDLSFEGQRLVEDAIEKEVKDLDNKELKKRINNSKLPKIAQMRTIVVNYRNSYLKEYVKCLAEWKCQLCDQEAPFKDKNGKAYLEEHHVTSFANGGNDEIGNIVALCPNCHRKMHILENESDINSLENTANQNLEKSKSFS